MVDDLIEGEQREVDRHQLHHRSQARHRRADPHADDRVLGDRRVAHAALPELLEQAVGDLEGAAEDADVLAHEEHPLVAGQLLPQPRVESLAIAHLRHHGTSSRRSPPSSPAASASVSCCGISWLAAAGTPVGLGRLRRPRRAGAVAGSTRPSTGPGRRHRARRRRRRASPAPGNGEASAKPPPRPRARRPARRGARVRACSRMPVARGAPPNDAIGSRSRHRATSSLLAVFLGVRHRVTTEAVRDRLDEQRGAVLAHALAPPRRARRGIDDVHPVAAHAGNPECAGKIVNAPTVTSPNC